MITIEKNHNFLTMEDINSQIYRARAVILNDNDEILMGYCGGIYQFPGGHVEQDETISEGLIREVKEETGIEIAQKEYIPFYKIKYLNKDYPEKNINRCTEFLYFLIKCNEPYNMENTNFDQYEKDNNFELKYIKIEEIIPILNEDLNKEEKLNIIYSEIISVIQELLENKDEILNIN